MKQVRFRHVLLAMFVFALAPELRSAFEWAIPVTLSIGSAPTINALAGNLLAVFINAAAVYGLLCLVRGALQRRSGPRT